MVAKVLQNVNKKNWGGGEREIEKRRKRDEVLSWLPTREEECK